VLPGHDVVIVPNVNLDCVAPFWVRPMLLSIDATVGRPARNGLSLDSERSRPSQGLSLSDNETSRGSAGPGEATVPEPTSCLRIRRLTR